MQNSREGLSSVSCDFSKRQDRQLEKLFALLTENRENLLKVLSKSQYQEKTIKDLQEQAKGLSLELDRLRTPLTFLFFLLKLVAGLGVFVSFIYTSLKLTSIK